jgi:hypothetical protein
MTAAGIDHLLVRSKRSTSLTRAIDQADSALPRGWVLIAGTMTTEEAGFDPPPDGDFIVAVAYRFGTDWRTHDRALFPALVRGLGPDVEIAFSPLGDPVEAFLDLAGFLRRRGPGARAGRRSLADQGGWSVASWRSPWG